VKELAIEHDLISSLEGYATVADISKAYFDGQLVKDNMNGELTREEFALLLGNYFNKEIHGKTLFDKAGFIEGPTGLIEEVYSERVGEAEAEAAYDVFQIVINGNTYQLHHHPKILNGPIDARNWHGVQLLNHGISRITRRN
jgi:hypothetical protein